ncbi:hypothetical protein [Burkholderia gladioli]|uniref:hypothetical protein n=1 Tax=Burkholderia gladioli TaxID=28095 RepID=UPI001ABAC0B5|nr:hypothetical protein [Burkholderia gladioli]
MLLLEGLRGGLKFDVNRERFARNRRNYFSMGGKMLLSEIRDSTKIQLQEKVRRHDFGRYLFKASIGRIRGFFGEDITFDFPVTALIGPNGSGKSAVLGAAGCAYKPIKPGTFFPKSAVGDESMSGWRVEYELVDKQLNPRQLVKRTSSFRQTKWVRGDVADRDVLFFWH